MVIKIPTLDKRLEDGELVKVKNEIEVDVDTSFAAHLKFEEEFAKDMDGIDLTTFTGRVQMILKDENAAKVKLITLLKWLYCHINSKKFSSFKEFLKLFDYEIANDILEKIKDVMVENKKTISTPKN